MTPEQELELTGGGDCALHHHSFDRILAREDLLEAVRNEPVKEVSANHTISTDIDYLLVDTSGGNVTITLPDPNRGISLTVIKVAAANTCTLDSPSGNINGAATYAMTSAYSHAKLKAYNGNYYVVG